MTTLRIEVGRHCSTTVKDVVEGLIRAGCMKDIEIDPDAQAFLPVEELKAALEAELFHVDLVPLYPEPPPIPWWRYPMSWPRRVYYWGRRVFLGESETEQIAKIMMRAYGDTSAVEAAAMRESPILGMIRRQTEEPEEEIFLRGPRGRSPFEDDEH